MWDGLSILFQLSAVWVAALLVASFLAIFWILRGSPSGQATAVEDDEDAPPPGYRDRVIAGVTTGLVLILLGGYLALTLTHGVRWSIPVFGLGIGLVLYLNIANRRYRHASPILRRTSDLASVFLNAGLLAGILMVANVAAFRYGGRGIDLTREQTFSLSSLSTNQLESLNRPVTFHIVYGSGPRSARQLDRVVQLLELYRAVRPDMIKIDSLNPYTELARAEDLAKRARPGGDEGRRRPDRVRRGNRRRVRGRARPGAVRAALGRRFARARTALSRSSRARTQSRRP